MAKITYHKCGFKGCSHPEDKIPTGEGVIKGRMYYHQECYDDMNTIQQIRSFYTTKISNTVVISYLNRVINDIVYKKHVKPDMLLFALKYAVSHHQRISSPAYLHYLVDNYKVKQEYGKLLSDKATKNTNVSVSIDDDFDFENHSTEVVIPKRRGFGDILEGK